MCECSTIHLPRKQRQPRKMDEPKARLQSVGGNFFPEPCSCYLIVSVAQAAYFINFLLKLGHVIIKLNCDTLYYALGLRDRHRIKKTISRHF